MNIIQDFIPKGRKNRPGHTLKPEYITVHDVGNPNKGANAEMHAKYLKGDAAEARPASWHFTVDEKNIFQHLPLNENGWHAGDGGSGPGNRKSIGIEICDNVDGNRAKAEENAVKLIAQLLNELNLPISAVVQHNHWSGKDCPRSLRANWSTFIKRIEAELKKGDPLPEEKPTIPAWKTQHVQWLKDQGYTDTVRDPDQLITWAEFGVILKRHFEKGGK